MKKYQAENNLNGKAILLVDNFSAHFTNGGDALKSDDGNIVVMYLPPNVTPLIQPMDQHIIKMIQSNYKCRLALRIINELDRADFSTVLKNYTIRNALDLLDRSWQRVTALNLSNSWDKIIEKWDAADTVPLSQWRLEIDNSTAGTSSRKSNGEEEITDESLAFQLDSDLADARILLRQLTGTEIDDNEIEKWFADEWNEENDSNDDSQCSSGDEENEVDKNASVPIISHQECLDAIDLCVKWATVNSTVEDICILKEFSDRVMQKKINQSRQSKLTDFFTKN